jgi:glycosyltransferase involved in cell wall biosynthesis
MHHTDSLILNTPKITIFASMKIAITGTRGIPNRYGGFEQFAEQLSIRLALLGHDVWVYNPSFHPFTENEFKKVKIVRKFSPEKFIGPAANYIYDLICLRDAVRRNADVILECGYATAVPALKLLNLRNSKLLINPDGMEWQRSKYSPLIRTLIQRSENTIAKMGFKLVCDNPELFSYYSERYHIEPSFIPYGADIFTDPDEKVLKEYTVKPFEYFLVIARFEPENNLRNIIIGFLTYCSGRQFNSSGKSVDDVISSNDINIPSDKKLLIVGNPLNRFGRKLLKEFAGYSNILFTNDIFEQKILDNLRYFSKAYFHGHSAGGTNPSLLEAMAAGSFIIAHDNRFNRNILKDNALYFNNKNDISTILLSENEWINKKESFVKANLVLIEKDYQWEDVTESYENHFKSLI